MNAEPAASAIPLPHSARWKTGPVVFGTAIVVSGFLAAVAADHPESYRYVLAAAVTINLLIIASRWPRAAAFLALLFLPFLALIRRLLISDAGWTSYDPLLLVGPLVAAFIVARLYLLEERRLRADLISKLVLGLLALALVQSFNPLVGNVAAGAGGFMFLGAPLLWFFIGRELGNRQLVVALLHSVVVLAIGVGVYGLWQTEVGLPSWDDAWVHLNGYTALTVYGVIRAFGTFSSSAEYGVFLGGAVVISLAMLLHRRAIFGLAIPLLAVPLFLASGRTALVLTVFAALVLTALRAKDVRLAIVIVVVGLVATIGVLRAYASAGTDTRNDPLVAHQVGGLTNPLDPSKSTLLVHVDLAAQGIEQGVKHPFGHGTAATNIAGDRFGLGENTKGTEVDVSNAFVSLGLLGGALLIALVIATFWRVVVSYRTHADPTVLAVLGVLIVALGQWLNGGYYAVAPLTWFLIGWATRIEDPSKGGSASSAPHRALRTSLDLPTR